MTPMSTGNMLQKMKSLSHRSPVKVDPALPNHALPNLKPSQPVPNPAPEMADLLANCLGSDKKRNSIPR